MKALEIVDKVFYFLENNKQKAVDALFPHADASYKAEWLNRDLYHFWAHLDLFNRREVIKLAVEHYK